MELTQPHVCVPTLMPGAFISGDEYFTTLIKNMFYECNVFFEKITSEYFVAVQQRWKKELQIMNGDSWIVVEGGRASLPSYDEHFSA